MKTLLCTFGIVSIMTLSTCVKEDTKISIILYDKPLEIIKSNIQGHWKLQKTTGGFCSTCGSPVKNNPYMIITGDHIVFGNDTGVNVDTAIVWQKIKYYYSSFKYNPISDSTYLLSIRAQKFYNLPINYVVDRIENNSLVLTEYASDPFSYFYEK